MSVQRCTMPGNSVYAGKKGYKWGSNGRCYMFRLSALRAGEIDALIDDSPDGGIDLTQGEFWS